MSALGSRFAAIADIHGNSDALRAVLDDMAQLGVGTAVNLGDFFSGPLDTADTGKLLRERDFPSIRGNHDRYLLEHDPSEMGPSDRVAFDQLSAQDIAWLKALPATHLALDDVYLCHGTPTHDEIYWLEQVRADGFIGMADRTFIEAQATDVDASLILCAHTHVQRAIRLSDGRQVVNPGSVGCPGYDDDQPYHHEMQTGTPDAAYAILERSAHGWTVSFRHVPYDTTRMVGLAIARGRAEWARAVGTGWVES